MYEVSLIAWLYFRKSLHLLQELDPPYNVHKYIHTFFSSESWQEHKNPTMEVDIRSTREIYFVEYSGIRLHASEYSLYRYST